MKITFLAPYGSKASGGIRVIFELSEALSKFNFIHSDVIQLGGTNNFTNGSKQNISAKSLDRESHLIIPDVYVSRIDPRVLQNKNYSIFIQNPYILSHIPRFNQGDLLLNIKNAANIFVISKDTENFCKMLDVPATKIKRLKWKLDDKVLKFSENLRSKEKENIISYMPRKCATDVQNFKLFETYIKRKIGYDVIAIEKMPFDDLCQTLLRSKIFIAFSTFEGFAAPPIEAMVLGNFVVGYHGNGNRELTGVKNFHLSEQQDIQSVINNIEKLTQIEYDHFTQQEYVKKFSPELVDHYNKKIFETATVNPTDLKLSDLGLPDNKLAIVYDRILNKMSTLR